MGASIIPQTIKLTYWSVQTGFPSLLSRRTKPSKPPDDRTYKKSESEWDDVVKFHFFLLSNLASVKA